MIKIKDYYITADNNCYAISKLSGKDKEGKDIFKTLLYPTTLQDCIKHIIRFEQRNVVCENDLTLSDAIDCFEKINAEIKEMMSKINEE